MRGFASDNWAGVHPRVLEALQEANHGHMASYGGDPYTKAVEERLRQMFAHPVDSYLVFNGTAANVLALQALTRPYQAVLCSHDAHIYVDECAAPEKAIGCKLLPLATPDGKLRPAQIPAALRDLGDVHRAQPAVLSLSQTTERGTVYRPEEIRELVDMAHRHGLTVHLDGARLANACAALNVSPAEMLSGVDAVTLGGTKAGMMFGEAVVFSRPVREAVFLRKQMSQLASKSRFLACQFLALWKDDLWLDLARRANACAKTLALGLERIPGIELHAPVEANAVFARLPRHSWAALQEAYPFSVWDDSREEVRLMTAWDTTLEDVENFLEAVRSQLA